MRKEESGSLTVVVSDAGEEDDRVGLTRLFRRKSAVVEAPDPAPLADTVGHYNDGFGGAAVPVGPRTVWLGGMRTGMGRSFPGREGNFHYPVSVALSASPVPSEAGGSFAGTPVALRSRSPTVSFVQPHDRRDSFRANARGPSVLFDSVCSPGSRGSRSSGSSGGGSESSPARDSPTERGMTGGGGGGERGLSNVFSRAAVLEK